LQKYLYFSIIGIIKVKGEDNKMKKTIYTKKHLKTVIAVALVAAMSLPVTAGLKTVKAAGDAETGGTTAAVSAEAVKVFDFNEGIREYSTDPEVEMKVVKTENVLVHKEEAEKEKNDKFDSNNIMVMIGNTSYYYKATVSNQPSTHVDSERGTVLYMGKTVNIDAVKKPQSAAIPGNDEATGKLDEEIPVPEGEDKTIQPAMTVRSELKFKSPLASETGDISVAMWINIPTVEGVDNALAGKWHHVVATKAGEGAAFYVDGVATENTQAAVSLTDWASKGEELTDEGEVVSGSTVYIGGYTSNAALFADTFGIVDKNASVMIDDIAMYKSALNAEQVKSIYDAASKTAAPVAKIIPVNSFSDISLSENEDTPGMAGKYKISVTTGKVNGSDAYVLSIPENKNITEKTGAFIKNPFAGKELDGATISFWTKQAKRGAKTSKGDEETSVISIIDTIKSIDGGKTGADGNAFSMVSFTSYINTIFQEGFSDNGVGNKLANNYFYGVADADRAKVNTQDWYYVTLVMSNAGVKTYVNGVCYENNKVDENGKSIATGPRFCDGDFQRAQDDVNIFTKYNIFGGSNNQCATSLMSFLKYDDTELYLGYVPIDGALNQKTNPTSFAGIRTFDVALTEDQVKALYADNTVYDDESAVLDKPVGGGDQTGTPGPSDDPEDKFLAGDADCSGKVDLNDAKIVLKVSLGINVKVSDQGKKNADFDRNGKTDLNDAKATLKVALGISVK